MNDMVDCGTCCYCKCKVWIPQALYTAAKASTGISFHCAHGHSMIFAQGETELDKMRRERDRLAQKITQRDDEIKEKNERIAARDRSLAATRGQVTKIKNRVAHGVCPCCNRTFTNLANHMKNQHPTFKKEEAA